MMTIVTHMTLHEGAEPEWDRAMRDRLAGANGLRGFVRSQLLIPLDGPNRRVIIGTWATRADWEAWHNDAAFLADRDRLEGLQQAPGDSVWYEVMEDQPPAGVGHAVEAVVDRVRDLVSGLTHRSTDGDAEKRSATDTGTEGSNR
jgi:heme-degrading monooxygenase HmoA